MFRPSAPSWNELRRKPRRRTSGQIRRPLRGSCNNVAAYSERWNARKNSKPRSLTPVCYLNLLKRTRLR